MNAIRIFTRSEKDGELLLQNLPVKKGQAVEVIVLTEGIADETALILSALQHDPGYAFLRDPAEDLYTEADVREVT
ncbi:MAG: hypothetical protein H5T62_06510 [Anaerolineae bacterium]|nr:hypothetical protein [Anaerolineae bacterium]